jgi:hypothetical protein
MTRVRTAHEATSLVEADCSRGEAILGFRYGCQELQREAQGREPSMWFQESFESRGYTGNSRAAGFRLVPVRQEHRSRQVHVGKVRKGRVCQHFVVHELEPHPELEADVLVIMFDCITSVKSRLPCSVHAARRSAKFRGERRLGSTRRWSRKRVPFVERRRGRDMHISGVLSSRRRRWQLRAEDPMRHDSSRSLGTWSEPIRQASCI